VQDLPPLLAKTRIDQWQQLQGPRRRGKKRTFPCVVAKVDDVDRGVGKPSVRVGVGAGDGGGGGRGVGRADKEAGNEASARRLLIVSQSP
jgi:hypothetical protein